MPLIISLYLDGTYCGVGWNTKGQLAQPEKEDVITPAAIALPATARTCTKVSAGWDFTLAITSSGKLLAWGNNAWGQLGIPQKQSSEPVRKTQTQLNLRYRSLGKLCTLYT